MPKLTLNSLLHRLVRSCIAITTTSFYCASSAWAAGFGGPIPDLPGTVAPGGEAVVRKIIVAIINAILSFVALIAVAVIVIAGIRLIVSQGEDDAKDKAKKMIIFALAGLAIILLARVIVGLITNYLAKQI